MRRHRQKFVFLVWDRCFVPFESLSIQYPLMRLSRFCPSSLSFFLPLQRERGGSSSITETPLRSPLSSNRRSSETIVRMIFSIIDNAAVRRNRRRRRLALVFLKFGSDLMGRVVVSVVVRMRPIMPSTCLSGSGGSRS